jgi:hypothetical protein
LKVGQRGVDVDQSPRRQPEQINLAPLALALALVIGRATIHRFRCHLLRVSLADGARGVATFLLAIPQSQAALDIA